MLRDRRAAALVAYLGEGRHAEAEFLGCRRPEANEAETVLFAVSVERPQDLAAPIARAEPVAAVFRGTDEAPAVLAAREDFPETPHQNAVPAIMPRALCIDDRPWDEVRTSWTQFSFIERVRWWFGAAASGELTGADQPLEPLFTHLRYELVVPRAALEDDASASTLTAFFPPVENPRVLLARAGEPGKQLKRAQIRLVTVRLAPQTAGPIRGAPATLAELAAELAPRHCDLLGVLRGEAVSALGSREALDAKLAVLLVVPIRRTVSEAVGAHDIKAFLATASVGEVGAALGCLLPSSEGALPFVRSISPCGGRGEKVRLDALRAVLDLDRSLAAAYTGRTEPDRREVVLVGAGAVGSHLALTLAREGAFVWTIVDDDHLLPHNLARHALTQAFLGFPKAHALAFEVGELLNEPSAARGIVAKLGAGPASTELDACLATASLVIDASASVYTARLLSEHVRCGARRASVFLNPAGTASVVLIEDAPRQTRLDALEAQYYRLLLRRPHLRSHLALPADGLRYSGSCRSVTSRIPATNVTALTGLAARYLAQAADRPQAQISIWSMEDDGAVAAIHAPAAIGRRFEVGEWAVELDDDLVEALRGVRSAALPAETGGVLVGIVDAHRRTVILVDALPPTADSEGTVSEFVRGTDGLAARLRDVQDITRDQVRYAGEWHSHPMGHSAVPSAVDLGQFAYLRVEMSREGLPPVMVIVGEREIGVLSADPE